MKPIDFPERTHMIAKDQAEYITLPAHISKSDRGEVVFCMKLTLWERIKLLITGKLWCCLLCFHKPVTPSFFTVKKSDIFYDTQEIPNNRQQAKNT